MHYPNQKSKKKTCIVHKYDLNSAVWKISHYAKPHYLFKAALNKDLLYAISNVILTCPRNKCLRLLAYFERKVRASSEISKIIRMQARIPAATRMGTSQISPLSTSKSGAQDEGYHSWWLFWLLFGFFIFLNTLVVLLLISTFLLLFSHSNKSVVHKSSIRSIEAGFKIGLLPNFLTKIGILGGIVDNLRRLLGVE